LALSPVKRGSKSVVLAAHTVVPTGVTLAVVVDDAVWELLPVWLGVCEALGVPVRLDVGVIDGVPVCVEVDDAVLVAVMLGVMVPVPEAEPVPVWLLLPVCEPVPLPVCDADGVPVPLAVCEGDAVPVPVCDDDGVLVPVREAVPDDEGVFEGVAVRVMVGGVTHTLTASTSSIDGAVPSATLRTRNTSWCVPGNVIVCRAWIQPDELYEPYCRTVAANSVSTSFRGDASVMATTSASSLANAKSSMPTQRTSNEMVVTSNAVTSSDSVV
jgi:hypothetical protein